jgi:hypothetical protein
MSFFKFFKTNRNRKVKRNSGVRCRVGVFERLEDRRLLTASVAESTIEFSENGLSAEWIGTATGPGTQSIHDDFDLDADDVADFEGFYDTSNMAADLDKDADVDSDDYDAFYALYDFGIDLDVLT